MSAAHALMLHPDIYIDDFLHFNNTLLRQRSPLFLPILPSVLKPTKESSKMDGGVVYAVFLLLAVVFVGVYLIRRGIMNSLRGILKWNAAEKTQAEQCSESLSRLSAWFSGGRATKAYEAALKVSHTASSSVNVKPAPGTQLIAYRFNPW